MTAAQMSCVSHAGCWQTSEFGLHTALRDASCLIVNHRGARWGNYLWAILTRATPKEKWVDIYVLEILKLWVTLKKKCIRHFYTLFGPFRFSGIFILRWNADNRMFHIVTSSINLWSKFLYIKKKQKKQIFLRNVSRSGQVTMWTSRRGMPLSDVADVCVRPGSLISGQIRKRLQVRALSPTLTFSLIPGIKHLPPGQLPGVWRQRNYVLLLVFFFYKIYIRWAWHGCVYRQILTLSTVYSCTCVNKLLCCTWSVLWLQLNCGNIRTNWLWLPSVVLTVRQLNMLNQHI